MTEIENRLRQLLVTEADRAQPDMLRPLRKPEATVAARLAGWLRAPAALFSRGTRAGRVLAPLAAAAAVIALVAGIFTAGRALTSAPAGSGTVSSTGTGTGTVAGEKLPPFYVTLTGKPGHMAAVARDSRTGAQLSSTVVPYSPGPGTWMLITAGGSRTFALAVPEGSSGEHFFRLRLTASGRAGKLTPLPVKPVGLDGSQVAGIALSPNGQQLAVAMASSHPFIEIASTSTGKSQTWTAPGTNYGAFDPAWVDNGTRLGFGWTTELSGGRYPTSKAEVRLLNPAAPGHSLLASRVVVPEASVPGAIQTALVTPDGRSVVASVTRNVPGGGYNHGKIIAKVVRFSAVTGRITATERTVTLPYHSSVGRYQAEAACQVVSLDPAGRNTLGLCTSLGHLAGSYFTPLPGSVAFADVPAVAW